jgi:hypothetical protein
MTEKELQALRELEAKASGELRYWPTHYMGTTPYIFTVAEDRRETQLFIARNAEGKTANTELRPYEGDRAIAYAKRMTAAANALPHLLAHITEQAKRIAELEETVVFKDALLKAAGVTSHTFELKVGGDNSALLEFVHAHSPKEVHHD